MNDNHTIVIDEPVGDGLLRRWSVSDVKHTGRTAFQDVIIGTTTQGMSLFCGGERQSTEQTQWHYHEALVIPGLLLAQHHRRGLIIGSSEGVASQMLVAQGFEHIDHVDIDAECVRLCAEHLPYGYSTNEIDALVTGAGPVSLIFADGADFVSRAAEAGTTYDVIIVDLPDESGEGGAQQDRLYHKDFLNQCAGLLALGGAVVYQAGCPTLWRQNTLIRSATRFHQTFASVLPYVSDEHEWVFLAGSSVPLDATAVVDQAVERLTKLAAQPTTIDAAAIRRGAILPHHVRLEMEQSR